jgi:hypothetical protein
VLGFVVMVRRRWGVMGRIEKNFSKNLRIKKLVVSLHRQHPPSLFTMLKSAGRFIL